MSCRQYKRPGGWPSWRRLALRGFAVLSLAGPALPVSADCQAVARLTQVQGQVSVKPAGKVVRVPPGDLPRPLCAGDEVLTFEGKAKVEDGRYAAVLDRFTTLAIQAGRPGVNGGKVLFDVVKREAASGVEVRTRLSVIGVKGTRFLVSDLAGEVRVAMDRGLVEVKSTQGPLGLYRESTQDAGNGSTGFPGAEFDAFVKAREMGVAAEVTAFEKHKSATRREFVAYVESLTLAARRELSIRDGTAVESAFGKDSAEDLLRLGDWL